MPTRMLPARAAACHLPASACWDARHGRDDLPTDALELVALVAVHEVDVELVDGGVREDVELRDDFVDLVNKYPREELPDSLTGYIRDRAGYDYRHHAEVGSSNAGFVGDEVTDRFCVLGEVDEVVAKLHVLADAGVDQFNVYLMNGDERDQLERIGREVIPAMASVAAG